RLLRGPLRRRHHPQAARPRGRRAGVDLAGRGLRGRADRARGRVRRLATVWGEGHRGRPPAGSGGARRMSEQTELQEERAFLLRSLRDLEHEHDAGDIDEAHYVTLQDAYAART